MHPQRMPGEYAGKAARSPLHANIVQRRQSELAIPPPHRSGSKHGHLPLSPELILCRNMDFTPWKLDLTHPAFLELAADLVSRILSLTATEGTLLPSYSKLAKFSVGKKEVNPVIGLLFLIGAFLWAVVLLPAVIGVSQPAHTLNLKTTAVDTHMCTDPPSRHARVEKLGDKASMMERADALAVQAYFWSMTFDKLRRRAVDFMVGLWAKGAM
eukprot:1496223-Rhodomonas_salina.2